MEEINCVLPTGTQTPDQLEPEKLADQRFMAQVMLQLQAIHDGYLEWHDGDNRLWK